MFGKIWFILNAKRTRNCSMYDSHSILPLLLYCFLSMPSECVCVCVCKKGGGRGLCFQGDENTRIQAAATVLCNRAVTSMMYKRLG